MTRPLPAVNSVPTPTAATKAAAWTLYSGRSTIGMPSIGIGMPP